MTKCILTIAGSDPSGGAGIQADLKTFSALGGYGMSVITALTAQNTQGVDSVLPVPADFVEQQFDSIHRDIVITSAKIGMLMNESIVMRISDLLDRYSLPFVVLDTVMVAKGGHPLLAPNAIAAIRRELLPKVSLITPNLPEAAALLGCTEAKTEAEMEIQAKRLCDMGCQAVLVKGGHLNSESSPDYLVVGEAVHRFIATRIATHHTHGTGCTLSAAIATLLPNHDLVTAIQKAKTYLTHALGAADRLAIGQGIGPAHHFHAWW